MRISICKKTAFKNSKNSYYPACPKSALFAAIAGTVGLTSSVLEIIKKLGYEIDIIKNNEWRVE